jgi:hypothetical protein
MQIKAFLSAHAGAWYCTACIAAALDVTADGARAATLWVRGRPGISLGQGACTACGTTRRLVLTATRPTLTESASRG